MHRSVLLAIAILGATGSTTIVASEATFDVEVTYADGRVDTVFDFHEALDRGFVRILCFIDGDARPKIPYEEISTIAFARSDRDGRKMAITITLQDGKTKQGILWGNDWFFGFARDGAEWKARAVNLSRLVFMASTETMGVPKEDLTPPQGDSTKR
ncbi:hypothetical protein JXA88_07120 [Candidatus Fermentibacteria bacterium]|nr:hypothetical protein [Candidatus Fermentibacteria bacterium]